MVGDIWGGQIAILAHLAKTVLTPPAKILPPENHILDSWLASSFATEGGGEEGGGLKKKESRWSFVGRACFKPYTFIKYQGSTKQADKMD